MTLGRSDSPDPDIMDHAPARTRATVHVLCLGYSITELPGYVEHANTLAAAEGGAVALLKSGWGGHSLPSIACLIDEILDALPCDVVLLELFTGNVRYFSPATMRAYLDDILAVTAKRDLPVSFLNLHQGGVDYANEPVAGLLAEYRALHAIPYLDLAAPLAAAPDRADLLTDDTHVTPQGAAFYGERVHAFLRETAPARDYVARFRRLPRRWVSLPVHRLPGPACTFVLRRNGIPLHFAEIPEGRSVEIPLTRRRRVIGALVTYGPNAGTLGFSDRDGGPTRSVVAYDEVSYYTRSVFRTLTLSAVETLRIAQSAGLPDIALRKGHRDDGPRLGRVSHIFCRRALGLAERATLLWHRSMHIARRAGLRLRER